MHEPAESWLKAKRPAKNSAVRKSGKFPVGLQQEPSSINTNALVSPINRGHCDDSSQPLHVILDSSIWQKNAPKNQSRDANDAEGKMCKNAAHESAEEAGLKAKRKGEVGSNQGAA